MQCCYLQTAHLSQIFSSKLTAAPWWSQITHKCPEIWFISDALWKRPESGKVYIHLDNRRDTETNPTVNWSGFWSWCQVAERADTRAMRKPQRKIVTKAETNLQTGENCVKKRKWEAGLIEFTGCCCREEEKRYASLSNVNQREGWSGKIQSDKIFLWFMGYFAERFKGKMNVCAW